MGTQAGVEVRKMKSIQPWESSAEVFSLEDSLPAQTVALILVYPTSSNYEEQKAKEATSLQGSADAIELRDLDVLWLSQKVQNACGPYALFHAVFNSSSRHHPKTLYSTSWNNAFQKPLLPKCE